MIRKIPFLALLVMLFLAASSPAATPATPVENAAPTTAPSTEPTEEAVAEPTTVPTVVAEETVTTTATVSATTALTGCLEPTADTQLISSPAAGYCFLIPATFARSEFSDVDGFNLGIYGAETTPGHRERGFINVTAATTQTLEAGVQAVIDDVLASLPGFTPTQSSLTLGGIPAIQLDGLPGQDIQRKIFAVNEGYRYELTFVPVGDTTRADATAEMEQLYALLVDSFRFMTPTTATSSYAALLTWEGELDGACNTLTIQANGEAAVGVCGDAPTMTATLDAANVEWVAVQQQFGDINAETPAGKIVFQGQGIAKGDQWAQSLATWASFTAMEMNVQRSSASVRTTLAWQLTDEAEHSGQCNQLVVLAYGYAYANLIPCDGNGQSTQIAAGWLTDAELDTFANWVANGARVEEEAGYLDANGTTPVTPEEITTWAKAIYARMIQ